MRAAVPLLIASVALGVWAPPSLAQGDDADKKAIKRILPDLDLVLSLYAKDEQPVKFKSLPKFSAKKLVSYPVGTKETVTTERELWKANKENYAKNNPLRAAIFEAMDEADKLKALELTMAIPWQGDLDVTGNYRVLTPKAKAAFLLKQEPFARAVYNLEQFLPKLKAAADKRDSEATRRWQATFDLAYARTLGNLVFLYEYNFSLGAVRADSLPELGKEYDGWKLAPKGARPNITETNPRRYAKERAQLLQKIQDEAAGTPWAYAAERESKRDLGMAWVVTKK